ncbi:unnamed protein product [Sphenostylis stenocarpa]|uniref:Uncharacterized protein n=1 Tax=Sphenostylis stenocarpa TaxID=92480 RepID=A0AA86VXZ8_9FABA|nr:unnamed protein product [Sphenostylis stenocarpa]
MCDSGGYRISCIGCLCLSIYVHQLNDALMHHTKQMSGYMTLLQLPTRSAGDVFTIRTALDLLQTKDILWMPSAAHREHRPCHDISFFSGYIRCGSLMLPYLPERVVFRQFGHEQGIPRSPCLGFTLFHTYIIPPREGDPPRAPLQLYTIQTESSSSDSHSCSERFERISKLLQSMLDLSVVMEGTEAWNTTQEALNISRICTETNCT